MLNHISPASPGGKIPRDRSELDVLSRLSDKTLHRRWGYTFLPTQHPVFFWLLFFLMGIFVGIYGFYFFVVHFLPIPDFFQNQHQTGTTKIFDRNGELLYEVLQPELGKKTVIPLKEIPRHFIEATLAAEDIHFYQHGGVDMNAVLRAIFYNIREQRIVSGASTIPQQLARNFIAKNSGRTYGDKIIETLYALRLSHLYTKDEILELYLNRIYYGHLSYGSETAALDYFGKHLSQLDLAESALLAGLPQRPSEYNPFLYFENAKKRQLYVLNQMSKYGFITEQEVEAASSEPLHFRRDAVMMKAPHFVHYVLNQLDMSTDILPTTQDGFSVYTTLDYNLQRLAEDTVSRRVSELRDKHVTNGALLSIDPKTGQILAWVGSENYFDESIDGEVDIITSLRQPGSSIKPFTYLLALEKGYTPATLLDDIPTEFSTAGGPYAPKNYDLRFHGPVRLRNALASSFNIPAVKTLEFVGVENFIAFLKIFGIDTFDQDADFYGLALTLGGGDVRMYDMVRGYNVIANYGLKRDLSAILKIDDAHHNTVYQWQLPVAENVLGNFGREHAYQIIDILKDPLARIGGFGSGSVLEISRDAAVKTGTTRNFRDNWTIGFTPELLTAVWVGNADATPMQNISGVDGAGPIWHDFMMSALESKPENTFVRPLRLREMEICNLSGKKPTEFCQYRIRELFVPGTEPKENDDFFRQFWVEKKSGHIVQEACLKNYPSSEVEKKVLVVYPEMFQKWAFENDLQLPQIIPCVLPVEYSNDYPNDTIQYKRLSTILLDSPHSKDEYLMESSLPLESQKIPFRVTVPLDTSEVSFFVDGKKTATVREAPFTSLWLMEKGKHRVRAEATMLDGTVMVSEEVGFEVH